VRKSNAKYLEFIPGRTDAMESILYDTLTRDLFDDPTPTTFAPLADQKVAWLYPEFHYFLW
jgi:hypothetical protein